MSERSEKQGFTLVEVLAAVFLLSIGLLAISSLQVVSMHGNANARDRNIASSLVASKINEFRSMEYIQELETGTTTVDARLAAGTTTIIVNKDGMTRTEYMTIHSVSDTIADLESFAYTLSWTIVDHTSQDSPGAEKRINASVTWKDTQHRSGLDVTPESGLGVFKIEVIDIPLTPKYM